MPKLEFIGTIVLLHTTGAETPAFAFLCGNRAEKGQYPVKYFLMAPAIFTDVQLVPVIAG